MRTAEVAADIKKLDNKTFTYLVPQQLAAQVTIGSRVQAELGHRLIYGYVVALSAEATVPGVLTADGGKETAKYTKKDTNKDTEMETGNAASRQSGDINLKPLLAVFPEETFLNEDLVQLARWMAETYLCSLSACLQTIISPKVSKSLGGTVSYVSAAAKLSAEQQQELARLAQRAPKQYALWLWLQQYEGSVPLSLLKSELACSPTVLKGLLAKGLVLREERDRLPGLLNDDFVRDDVVLTLNKEQAQAFAVICVAIRKKRRESYLLHGVTGSGKTEIYLRAIAETVALGRQAIMLVPEIALTPQMVDIFRRRFGDRIVILHSQLAAGEKNRQLKRVREHLADVVIGTRSAVFAPCSELGLIIIDEEHEHTYKQEENPKYITQEVARKRADQSQAVLLLGSATPSLETYYYARAGRYQILRLAGRVNQRSLPQVTVIDQRGEQTRGNSGVVSEMLLLAISNRLEKNEQVLLFLNRRGYASFVHCRACGYVLRCPHCDISLTLHQQEQQLKCHYCGYSIPMAVCCPQCGKEGLQYYGLGTQRLEEEVSRLFPQAVVLRMDSDTMRRKGAQERAYRQFKNGQADILIGTQMIAKGFHFPNVTLVGVVSADTMLNIPDFRSAEKTFQLLTQVAGRAGRGAKSGEVLIQTYNPDHYAVQLARTQDYQAFVYQELKIRQLLAYPPFVTLSRVLIQGTVESDVQLAGSKLRLLLEREINSLSFQIPDPGQTPGGASAIEILGPAPAPLSKLKDQFRWHLLLKGKRRELQRLLKTVNSRQFGGNIKLIIDLVPQMML